MQLLLHLLLSPLRLLFSPPLFSPLLPPTLLLCLSFPHDHTDLLCHSPVIDVDSEVLADGGESVETRLDGGSDVTSRHAPPCHQFNPNQILTMKSIKWAATSPIQPEPDPNNETY